MTNKQSLAEIGRELDDAICDLRNCMASPLIVELGGVYTRLVSVQKKFRSALRVAPRDIPDPVTDDAKDQRRIKREGSR